jgi:transcriptional regulator with XRE-family HTH domain
VSARTSTSDAVEILNRRYFKGRPEMIELLRQARLNAELAQKIYDLRRDAGLTQSQLAQRVGTTASVISRLEDADYEGHSLAMLQRIAAAVGKRVQLSFVTADPGAPGAPRRPGRAAKHSASRPKRGRPARAS